MSVLGAGGSSWRTRSLPQGETEQAGADGRTARADDEWPSNHGRWALGPSRQQAQDATARTRAGGIGMTSTRVALDRIVLDGITIHPRSAMISPPSDNRSGPAAKPVVGLHREREPFEQARRLGYTDRISRRHGGRSRDRRRGADPRATRRCVRNRAHAVRPRSARYYGCFRRTVMRRRSTNEGIGDSQALPSVAAVPGAGRLVERFLSVEDGTLACPRNGTLDAVTCQCPFFCGSEDGPALVVCSYPIPAYETLAWRTRRDEGVRIALRHRLERT